MEFVLEFLRDMVRVRVSLLFFCIIFFGCENSYFIVNLILLVLICFRVFFVFDFENFIFIIVEIVVLFGGFIIRLLLLLVVLVLLLLLIFFILILEYICRIIEMIDVIKLKLYLINCG